MPARPAQPDPDHAARPARVRALRCAAMGAWLSLTLPALAQQVVVVPGGDAEPYRLATQGCLERLAAAGIEAVENPLDDANPTPTAAHRVYVAVGTRAAAALARDAVPGAAVVYCMISWPEAEGLPERERLTGVTTSVPPARQFELIHEIAPGARRIGVLHRAGSATSRAILDQARADLPSGWSLETADLDSSRSVADAISLLVSEGTDAVWTIPDPAVYDAATVKALLLAALRAGKPVFGFSNQLVKAGTIAGVGIDPADQGRQAADLALKLVKDPSQVPAPLTPDFTIAVNLVVAEKLDIPIPQSVVSAASEVFR